MNYCKDIGSLIMEQEKGEIRKENFAIKRNLRLSEYRVKLA